MRGFVGNSDVVMNAVLDVGVYGYDFVECAMNGFRRK